MTARIDDGHWDYEALDNIDQKSNGKPHRPVPLISSLRDLVTAHPAMRPVVIDGLLRTGETMNVIAQSKRGKSWLTNQLALSVIGGRKWLDTFQCTSGRVLILDAELHKEVIAHRIPAVAQAMNIAGDDFLGLIDVVPLRGIGHDLISLDSFIRSIDPGYYVLAILDAWYRFLPVGISENDNGQIMSLYNRIDAYAAHLQSAWVNIHHTSKGDQSGKSVTDVGSGAGSQSRAADTHLIIRPHEDENVSVFEAAVRSFPPIVPIAVRWDFPLWRLASDADPRKLKGLKLTGKNAQKEQSEIHLVDDRQAIIQIVGRLKGPETKTDIFNRTSGIGEKRFNHAFLSLTDDGSLRSESFTKGRGKHPYQGWRLRKDDES